MNHTLLSDLLDYADLERGIAERLITVRDDGAGLRILNYSDAALYTPGAWDNPAVRVCRGLIVDANDRVVARPWAKFFNYGQPEAGTIDYDAPVEVTDKLDGSLGIIHLAGDGRPRVATRGSFQSDQAIHATAVLAAKYADRLHCLDEVTPLVEIIYPGNRIVVDYDDLDDLVLLGAVEIASGRYFGPEGAAKIVDWTGPRAKVFDYPTLTDALAAEPRPGMEGLCARNLLTGQIVKIKQDDYVRLHRIVTGLSERTVWEHMVDGRPLNDLLAPLPDELHGWTRAVWDNLELDLQLIYNDALVAHRTITNSLPKGWVRRDYAEQAKQRGPLTPYLFNLLDGRDPRPSILRTLKPAGDTRAKAISEAVA